MVSPTELDLFTRSLSGDRRARTELYKKYVRASSRVGRLGVNYEDPNEFLQDCFANLLRTGSSWDRESGLSKWVESVAVWTALMNERQRDMSERGARNDIRICAEIEGEDATHQLVLDAYAPPASGPDDSPAARLYAILTEPEKIVLRMRGVEHASWDAIAAAAGKPIQAIGPTFARVMARMARMFGAPPPMDDDLVPVFSRAAADPQKPEGRAISLQLDASFYGLAPEMQRIGVTTAYDARMLVLWDTVSSATPPGDALRRHLDQCHYCSDLLRALNLLQQALLCAPGSEFHLCPGSFTLATSLDTGREVFDQHLAQCSLCRNERTQVLGGEAPRLPSDESEEMTAGAGKKIAYATIAIVLLGAASFAGYRFYTAGQVDASKTVVPEVVQETTPTVSVDMRYKGLVQDVPLDDARILASVRPENRAAAKFVIGQASLGSWSQALMVSSQLATKGNDAGIQMLYAMGLYRSRLMTDGYREMLKSEAMSPRDSFRCWVMLQFALMVGDRNVLEREAEHLSADPAYKDRVKKLMDRVKAVG